MSDDKDKENSFEKQLNEFKEWQDNAYNPGHYIGTGRIPLSTRILAKRPVLLILIGISILLPTLYNIISDFELTSIAGNIIFAAIGSAIIYGGIVRIKDKRKK